MMSILTEKDGFTYALLKAEDLDHVADMMARGFTDGSEPTALALGLGPEDFKQFVEALLPKFLREGLSIVARDAQTGEIAGAQLNDEMGLDLPVELSQFEWVAPVVALAEEMYRQYFEGHAVNPNESAHFFLIGVFRSYRGKGVGHRLLELSLEHARARGYRRAVVEASGLISQHILRKAGFTTRVEIPYATFEYEEKRPFENTGDHPSIMLMDKDL
jgi:ribosomal protein S18 acetylase RimI-like enzyme